MRETASAQAIGYLQGTIYEELTCDLAYVISPAWQRRGYATEACRGVLAALWKTYGVERVEITLDERNVASARVAARLGFAFANVVESRDYHTGRPTRELTLRLERPAPPLA